MELTNSPLSRRCGTEEYLGSFFLDPEDIGCLSLRANGKLVKVQGSLDLVLDYGAQWACFKVGVHWDYKGLNPTTNLISSDVHYP